MNRLGNLLPVHDVTELTSGLFRVLGKLITGTHEVSQCHERYKATLQFNSFASISYYHTIYAKSNSELRHSSICSKKHCNACSEPSKCFRFHRHRLNIKWKFTPFVNLQTACSTAPQYALGSRCNANLMAFCVFSCLLHVLCVITCFIRQFTRPPPGVEQFYLYFSPGRPGQTGTSYM